MICQFIPINVAEYVAPVFAEILVTYSDSFVTDILFDESPPSFVTVLSSNI